MSAEIKPITRLKYQIFLSIAMMLAAILSARAASTAVGQAGQVFSVKLLSLTVGDTAVFKNDDGVRHNIRIINEDDDTTDVGTQQPGDVLTYKFTKAGKFRVRCGIHPGMKLTVIVK